MQYNRVFNYVDLPFHNGQQKNILSEKMWAEYLAYGAYPFHITYKTFIFNSALHEHIIKKNHVNTFINTVVTLKFSICLAYG